MLLRSRFRLLATFQALAGVAILPYGLHDWQGRTFLVLLCAIAWLTLAAVDAIGADRLHAPAFDVSVGISAALIPLHAAVTSRPQMQVFDALLLQVIMLFAVFAMPPARVRITLALAACGYLAALVVNPLPLGIWIPPVMLAMIVAATEVCVRLVDQVSRVSRHDPLTGALNRAGLRSQADAVRALAARNDLPTTVAFIDVDGFKGFNDAHGHAAGDQLLVHLVEHFRALLRNTDLVARTGGDEFVLVLPGLSPVRAEAVIDRLRVHTPIDFTYGVAAWPAEVSFLDAVDEADQVMYRHKQRRRRAVGDRTLPGTGSH